MMRGRTAEQFFATLDQVEGGAEEVGQAMSAMEAAPPEQLAGFDRSVAPERHAVLAVHEAARHLADRCDSGRGDLLAVAAFWTQSRTSHPGSPRAHS